MELTFGVQNELLIPVLTHLPHYSAMRRNCTQALKHISTSEKLRLLPQSIVLFYASGLFPRTNPKNYRQESFLPLRQISNRWSHMHHPLQHFNPLLLSGLRLQGRPTEWLVVINELRRHSELSLTVSQLMVIYPLGPPRGLRQMTTGSVGRTHPSAERIAPSSNLFTSLSCLYAFI